MTTLEQLSADPDASATVDEMRDFHRTAGPESLLAFQYALHALAAPIHWANQTWRDDRNSEWVEDRHKGCRGCRCPLKSVGQCGNPRCGLWIASVQVQAPKFCSDRCSNRAAHDQRRALDERIIEIVRNYPDGIEVDLIANHLKVDRRRVAEASGRLAKRKSPPIAEWRERMPGTTYATTWYLVPVYDSEGARP